MELRSFSKSKWRSNALCEEDHIHQGSGQQIAKVNQTISRLIDGYTEGLIDKDEFSFGFAVRGTARRTAKGNCNLTPI